MEVSESSKQFALIGQQAEEAAVRMAEIFSVTLAEATANLSAPTKRMGLTQENLMSGFVRDLIGYETSDDYDKLWGLAHQQSIVCLALYERGIIDVAQTICYKDEVSISARGITYVSGWDKETFLKGCQGAEVRWVLPNKTPPPTNSQP